MAESNFRSGVKCPLCRVCKTTRTANGGGICTACIALVEKMRRELNLLPDPPSRWRPPRGGER